MRKFMVVWTEEALNDLDEIYDFLALKSGVAADKIIFKLLTRVKQLESFPESGPLQEGLKKRTIDF